jgi:hypothetical protein
MTRTQIRDLLGRNRSANRIEQALAILDRHGCAERIPQTDTGGRPAEVWIATPRGK